MRTVVYSCLCKLYLESPSTCTSPVDTYLPWPPPIRQEALPGAWKNLLTIVSEGVGSSVPAAAMAFVLNTGSYTCRHDRIGYQGERELMIRGELALHLYSGLNWIPFQILCADSGGLNSKTDGLVLSCFSSTTFLSSAGSLVLWDFRLYFSPIVYQFRCKDGMGELFKTLTATAFTGSPCAVCCSF